MSQDITAYLRTIHDFPKPGIQFKDISPLLNNPEAWETTIDQICRNVAAWGITKVVGMESRGFLVGVPVATELGVGFVMARKPGKLPGDLHSVSYGKEYGTDSLHMVKGLLTPEDRVLIVDDLLATGGTALAAAELVKLSGATTVGYAFIIELTGLKGGEKLTTTGAKVYSCVSFD